MGPETPKKFVGDKEVLTVSVNPEQTKMGGKILTVQFVDGSSEILTEKTYLNVVSETPVDLTTLREKRVSPIVREILVLMRESNLKVSEIEYMIALLVESVNQNTNAASNKLWNVKDGEDRTFLMIDKILSDESKSE